MKKWWQPCYASNAKGLQSAAVVENGENSSIGQFHGPPGTIWHNRSQPVTNGDKWEHYYCYHDHHYHYYHLFIIIVFIITIITIVIVIITIIVIIFITITTIKNYYHHCTCWQHHDMFDLQNHRAKTSQDCAGFTLHPGLPAEEIVWRSPRCLCLPHLCLTLVDQWATDVMTKLPQITCHRKQRSSTMPTRFWRTCVLHFVLASGNLSSRSRERGCASCMCQLFTSHAIIDHMQKNTHSHLK